MKPIKSTAALLLILCLCLSGCYSAGDDLVYFDPLSTSDSTPDTSGAVATSESIAETTTEITTETTVEATTEETTEETTEATEEATEEPTKAQEKKDDSTSGDTVWIPTKGGKKYHAKASCSNMSNPEEVTKEEAEDRGFTPCKKCYK